LSVKPNVTLTFGSGKRIYVSGTLSTNSATFQGNGSAGYWNSITLLSGSSGSILNTTIKDAQCGIYATQVSSLTVSNCTIENNSSYGISLSSTDPTISNCTIQSNGTGINSSSSLPTISGCTIQNNINYGINASSISPSGNYLYWYNNTFTGNGYAVVLNNASPYLHDNDIFDNSHGVVMTSSSTNFADPSKSWKGYNEITCASTPLFKADNYSSIYAGYGYDGGYNSIFGSEQPDMQSLNHSTIYACNNYWGSPYPATYADGTSTILSWYPLGSDPNSSSCSLNKRSVLAKSTTTGDDVDFPEQLANAIASGFDNDFSTAKNLLKTIIEDKYDNTYTPLALLTYYNFDLKDQDLNATAASDYSNDILTSVYDRSKEDPLRPFAVRLLARDAALKDKTDQMILYNNEIIEYYPNSSNEVSALYDLTNYYYETEQNNLATKYLKRMEEVYPENDLTLFAKINLGLYSMELRKDNGAINQQIPAVFSLSDNYPNPFNPSTTINYSLPVNEKVVLKVYDILGKEVAILVNEQKPEGNYQVIFNAENLASGLYLYQIKSGTFIQTKKMILMK
jgi:parallel beta-helix repeat protein